MKKICVLLSSYNGEKYIHDQIESILQQQQVNVTLIIRDDCSKDETVKIIKEMQEQHSNIELLQGANIGPAMSFLELIRKAPAAEFYALSDQDDVWDYDKLIKGIQFLSDYDPTTPLLYHCNTQIVDSNLQFLRIGKTGKQAPYSKYGAFMENHATGCTMIFNRSCQELIASCKPDYVSMHDSWIYLIAEMFGKVIYDPQPHMKYRQHGNNVIGAKLSKKKYISEHMKRVLNTNIQPRMDNTKSFYKCYKNRMSKEDKDKVEKFINYKRSFPDKLKFLIDKDFHAPSLVRNIEYFIMIMIGNI